MADARQSEAPQPEGHRSDRTARHTDAVAADASASQTSDAASSAAADESKGELTAQREAASQGGKDSGDSTDAAATPVTTIEVAPHPVGGTGGGEVISENDGQTAEESGDGEVVADALGLQVAATASEPSEAGSAAAAAQQLPQASAESAPAKAKVAPGGPMGGDQSAGPSASVGTHAGGGESSGLGAVPLESDTASNEQQAQTGSGDGGRAAMTLKSESAAQPQAQTPTNVAAPASSGGAPVPQVDAPAQAATAPAMLPQTDAAETDPNVTRVMRGLNNAVNQNGGTVTLRLTPPELGVVRIQMDVAHGSVRAQLTVESESVRHLLNHQVGQLRQALEHHGLAVERLEVHSGPPAQAHSFDRDQQRGGDGRSRGQFTRDHQHQRNERQDAPPRQFERELLDAVA